MEVYPANMYFFKVNNRNSRKRSEIFPKCPFLVNNEHTSHLFLVFLLLILNK